MPRLASEWEQVCGLFEVVDARAHGFRLLDPSDYRVLAGQGVLSAVNAEGELVGVPGGGYGMPALQAVKRYSYGARSYYRRLPKLVSGTVVGTRNGVPLVVGASPGQVAVDVNTGRITFVADDTRAVVAVTVGATTQVQLAVALVGAVIGDRVYLAGLGGAGALLVNGLSHEITNIVGPTYTLDVDTAGTTITPSGTGALYPQADDVLAFTAHFHVAVRFDTDELSWSSAAGGDESLWSRGPRPCASCAWSWPHEGLPHRAGHALWRRRAHAGVVRARGAARRRGLPLHLEDARLGGGR